MINVLNTRAGGSAFLVLTVAAVGYFALKHYLPKVGNAINPTSKDNIVYTGVNSVGEVLTGRKDFDLGNWIFDITHPDDVYKIDN